MTITCTAPGCGQPGALQWQRAATTLEAETAGEHAQITQDAIHKHRHQQATLHLIGVRRQITDAEQAAKGDPDHGVAGDHRARAILPTLHANAAAALADVEALETDGPDVVPVPTDVTVAVFGCTTHAVTPDAATWLHQPGCLTTTPGACTCTPPVED